MVPPRKANSRRPSVGSRSRWRWKSPTTACTARPGYSPARAVAAAHRVVVAHVEGTYRLRRAGGLHGVEQDP